MAPGRGRGGFNFSGNTSRGGPSTRANPRSGNIVIEEPEPTSRPTSPPAGNARAARTPTPFAGFDYTAMATAFLACRQMEDMIAHPAGVIPTAAELAAERADKEAERWLKLSERIVKICPKQFLGTEGAIAARRWIQEMERHLDILHCTPSERIRLAVYRLAGDARSWWDSCIRHQGRDALYASTWDEFVLLFETKYVPAYEKARLKEQYESLVQGSMTVEQYYREFDHLSYYGSSETELDRVHRFKKGFHPSLRHKVGHMPFSTVLEVVSCASEAESVNSSLRASSELGKRKFDAMSRPVAHSGFTRPPQITSPAGGSSFQRAASAPGTGSGLFNGTCHNCGIYGHAWKDCKKYGGGAYGIAARPQQTGGTQGQYQERTQQHQIAESAVRPPGQQLATTPQNPQPVSQKAPAAARFFALRSVPEDVAASADDVSRPVEDPYQPVHRRVPLAAYRPGGPVFALHGEPEEEDMSLYDGSYQPCLHWGEDLGPRVQHYVDGQEGVAVLDEEAKVLELKALQKLKIAPACISELEELLRDVFSLRCPKPSDYDHRRDLIRDFNVIAKEIYGKSNCPVVEEFGSFLMDIFNAGSDLDLSINFNGNFNGIVVEFPRAKKIMALKNFAKRLHAFQRKGRFTNLQRILTARVPIVKVVDCGTGIECDISVENRDGIVKSRIVHMICSIDERFQKLSFLMKAWAKEHDINSSKDRTLNSLSITLLVAFHLQTRDPPILPPFSAIVKDGTDPDTVMRNLENYKNYGKKNEESVAELFFTLFVKLAAVETLWPSGLCCSTYEGAWIFKEWNSKVANMSVEDFSLRSENITRVVGEAEVRSIYNCIHQTLEHLMSFQESEIPKNELRGLMFGSDDNLTSKDKGTTTIVDTNARHFRTGVKKRKKSSKKTKKNNDGSTEANNQKKKKKHDLKKMHLIEGWEATQQSSVVFPHNYPTDQLASRWGPPKFYNTQNSIGFDRNRLSQPFAQGPIQMDNIWSTQSWEGGIRQYHVENLRSIPPHPMVHVGRSNPPFVPTENPIGYEGSNGHFIRPHHALLSNPTGVNQIVQMHSAQLNHNHNHNPPYLDPVAPMHYSQQNHYQKQSREPMSYPHGVAQSGDVHPTVPMLYSPTPQPQHNYNQGQRPPYVPSSNPLPSVNPVFPILHSPPPQHQRNYNHGQQPPYIPFSNPMQYGGHAPQYRNDNQGHMQPFYHHRSG